MASLEIILAFTFFGSILSLLIAAAISLREDMDKSLGKSLVSFAAGALMGTVFLDMLPEIAGAGATIEGMSMIVLAGISVFFVVERLLLWHHHHNSTEEPHPYGLMLMVGDGLHNFVDGVIITASFLVDTSLGIVTAFAVFMHEIPQEIGDFAVLLNAGFEKRRALIYNLISGLTAVAGALSAWFLQPVIQPLLAPILAFAAGGFIYIAGTDLMPSMHSRRMDLNAFRDLAMFFVGIGIILLVSSLLG